MPVSGVTPQSLRGGLLFGLMSPGKPLAGVDDGVLLEAIEEAEAEVQQSLSTRFAVTEFQGWLGAGTPPVSAGVESEGPYEWPGSLPGDRFPAWNLRVRPIVEVLGVTVTFPGSFVAPVSLAMNWFRVDHLLGELTLAPQGNAAPLFYQGAGIPLVGIGGHQVPDSVLINYKAGLGEAGLKKYPTIKRLVALEACIKALPTMALMLNPTMLSSQSADGLSETRRSGYIFQDLEDRLRNEADTARAHILDLWEGVNVEVL